MAIFFTLNPLPIAYFWITWAFWALLFPAAEHSSATSSHLQLEQENVMSPAQHGAHCSIMGCCFYRPMKKTPPEQRERRWLLVIFPSVVKCGTKTRESKHLLQFICFQPIFCQCCVFKLRADIIATAQSEALFPCRSSQPLYKRIYYSFLYLIQGAMNCLSYFKLFDLLFSNVCKNCTE